MAFDPRRRDALVAGFRRKAWEAIGYTPFRHQAEVSLASEGWSLVDRHPQSGERYVEILTPNPEKPDQPEYALREERVVEPRRGGPARILADLAAFKAGKSYGTAAWLVGFAVVPQARIQIVGLEYSSAEPEFTYLEEFLLSSRGLGMNATQRFNDPDHGRMKIILKNGCIFEVKSWARKEVLKGKKITCYVYAEAYQLPGMRCYTSVKQNLRQLHGWALFPTTPDRPWVGTFHEYGHGQDLAYHCTCNVDARENPFTYSQSDRDRDDPDKGGVLTREKFMIAWCGKLGHFVGQVYPFVRGQQQFTPLSHPFMWKEEIASAHGL